MSYITGDITTLCSRTQELPTSTGDVNNFLIEAQGYLASGLMTSGHRFLEDFLLRHKTLELTNNPSGITGSLLY